MRATSLSVLAGLLAALIAVPALAQDKSTSAKATSDIELLGRFDIVIGDLGNRFDGWDNRDTRVYVEVDDGWRRHRHYFDNLPSAIFVLREMYGRARIVDIGVPEYSGARHEQHGHEGHGLINGMRAWYVWDDGRYSRGGAPLVLSFYDWRDADEEAYYRRAEVLDYDDVLYRLNRWAERERGRIYWRGWDGDRWNERGRWDNAWNRRWEHSRWDRHDGWSGSGVQFRIGDFTFRWEDDGHDHRSRHRGRDRDDHYDRDRDRDRDRGRDRDRDHDDRDRDRVRGRDRDRDRDHDRDRDRDHERNSGSKRTQEK